ncbi:50S ribosomal protein L25 [Romboutsia sp. CE17]|uniref:50S ribosomal protein L25 n=1 Tax=Romboutsia sp. CE17 TaxID=2724150 RepID=UPI001442D27C|nr:50S ribosomal protein L25 [Romboutsia sp. CE17]QJA08719.1 50S ribosomal protein L25 [Romboutsia sp. CE17]
MRSLVFSITDRNEKGYKVRKGGEIPCILYGQSLEVPIKAKITKRELINLLKSDGSSVILLNLNGINTPCVLKELQRDALGDIVHIDFQCVNKYEPIKLRTPINFIGQESLESKRLVVEVFVSDIQLQGLASDIPPIIEIDVSKLNYGDQITSRDIAIPVGVKIDFNEETIIAKVGAAK